MASLNELADQVFSHLLQQSTNNCTACEENQPNQMAHYSGCFFPTLDFDDILPAIEELSIVPTLPLWYKVAKLVDVHNEESHQALDFYAQ